MLLLYYVSWQHLLYIACIVVITGFYNIQCNTAELILLGSPRKSIYRVAQKNAHLNRFPTKQCMYCPQHLLRVPTLPCRNNIVHFLCCLKMKFAHELCWQTTKYVNHTKLYWSVYKQCSICPPRSRTTRSSRRRHSLIARLMKCWDSLLFAPLRDNCILQLLDWGESSMTINHLLDGTPNSVVDWI